ncbi:MAG: tetratricopeptide repeat protein [Candidatus Helarchaeota archaeon]|nr:tetratricopeptide repeat protein [Candidatus Helarchaeota archaeon]
MKADEWFHEGNKNIYSKNYKKAIQCFNKSLEINSQKATPWYNLGIAYLHINLNPIYSLIFYIINWFSLESNPYYLEDKIVECFKKAITIDPEFLDAWYNLGFYYFELEEYKKAINCFKEILKKDPENLDTLYILGKVYQELKEYKLELKYLKNIIAINPIKTNLPIKKIKKRIKELEKK